MADRTVYGRTHSENGWRMVDAGSCVWVKVPGTNVTLQIREGQPAAIMGAFAADYNAHVEPLRDADSACWTPTNSVASSNHLSGTGMDLNWNGPDGKTFRLGITKERAYPGDKARKLDELIEFYEGMIFCGGNWSIRDWMHFQMGGNTYGAQHVEKVNDFIRRKIRGDGFSTFKRAGTVPLPPPPPPATGAADILARATGLPLARAIEILPTMVDGLKQAQCTNANRIAMFIAQTGHESANFQRTEEYASGAAYEGRCKDLGNCQPGDGVRFKGRSWIQITGRHNYGQFSKWAHGKGLVPSPTYFVDRPVELQDLRWAGTGAAWYWTVARSDINALSDRRDLDTVTRRINGGTNGLADRRTRYNRALALGDQLLALTNSLAQPSGDDMALVPQDQWDRVFRELTQRHPSRSPLRALGEGDVDTWAGMSLNSDGNIHVIATHLRALLGHPKTLRDLEKLATADPAKWPDRRDDIQLAQSILADVTAAPQPAISTARVQSITEAPDTGTLVSAVTAAVHEAAASIPAPVVVNSAPEPPAPSATYTGTPGQVLGQVYDAIAALDLSADLPPETKAALSAVVSILQVKIGASA